MWLCDRLVGRGGEHLAPDDAAPPVGDLLRALVDEQDEDLRLGVVDADGVRELLEQLGLAGLGRGDDQAALALADRVP